MLLPDDIFSWTYPEADRREMTEFIRTHFAGVLGDDIRLLDLPNGLELIQEKIGARLAQYGVRQDNVPNAA